MISDNYSPMKSLGNGATTQFSDTWSILNAGYLVVELQNVLTGAITPQILGSDYTVSFDDSGFIITFTIAPPSTVYVVAYRNVAIDQTNPYSTAQGFQGRVTENSFDKITAITQDLADAVDRSPKLAIGSTVTGITIEDPIPGRGLIWDASGTILQNSDSDFNDLAADAAASAAAALVSQNAAAASAASASTSATDAANSAARLVGNSTTSSLIALGSKVFTTQANKQFFGEFVILASAANTNNYMFGMVTAYTGTTLTVNVSAIGGTGTFSDWQISVAGAQGAQGAQGIQGAPGATGSGSGDVTGAASSVNNEIVLMNGTSGKVIKGSGILCGTMAAQNSSGVSITGGTIAGITDLAVADGGTGASNAAGARTNLGLGNVANVDTTNASNITSGTLAIARVASGTPDGTKYVRDDGTLAAPTPPLTLAAVGTYALLKVNSLTVAGVSVTSGSGGKTLAYSDANNFGGTNPPGTWRAMGTTNTADTATLFLRIS